MMALFGYGVTRTPRENKFAPHPFSLKRKRRGSKEEEEREGQDGVEGNFEEGREVWSEGEAAGLVNSGWRFEVRSSRSAIGVQLVSEPVQDVASLFVCG